jgi:hypothetical protein
MNWPTTREHQIEFVAYVAGELSDERLRRLHEACWALLREEYDEPAESNEEDGVSW